MLKFIARATISIILAVACTVLIFLLLHYSTEGPLSNSFGAQFLGRLFFWPAHLFGSLAGLDCPAADSLAEKSDCIRLAVALNLFTYTAVCLGVLAICRRRRRAF
jgi:hypothetical protein